MMWLRQLFGGVLALLASTALAWADPVGQVVKLNGTVELIRGNATGALVLGAVLEAGDKLKTDSTSRVRLQLIDGSIINLGSQSELSIDEVVSGGPGTERHIGLDLWLGALRTFAAPATPNSRFEIRTPRAITAVRGTEWGILASALESQVLVLSGRVGVRKNEVSGKSAISLTRTLGVTVTDQGLGQITRWDPARVAALLAATAIAGPEMGFDLGKGAGLNLAPIKAPVAPDGQPQPGGASKFKSKYKRSCVDPGDSQCIDRDKRDRDRDRPDHDQQHEHEKSNDGNSTD